MTKVALARTQKAEAAIRQFGLNPDILARQATSAQGGPFESFFGSSKKDVRDPRFTKLAMSLGRMDAMERALAAIPTSMPAAVMMMSSGWYRSDPATGGAQCMPGFKALLARHPVRSRRSCDIALPADMARQLKLHMPTGY
jgi:hypothetical protein